EQFLELFFQVYFDGVTAPNHPSGRVDKDGVWERGGQLGSDVTSEIMHVFQMLPALGLGVAGRGVSILIFVDGIDLDLPTPIHPLLRSRIQFRHRWLTGRASDGPKLEN